MEDCLFCKIVKKEISAEIVYENEVAIGLLDVHPKAPGHTMVIPKNHVATILNLPENETGPFFIAVKNATRMLQKALVPDGFNIGLNHGKDGGQTIDHLHVHIIPRYKGDGGTSMHGIVDNPPQESLQEIKEKILQLK